MTHPELRAELLRRAERDQSVRQADHAASGQQAGPGPIDVAAMQEVDADNSTWLAPLLERHGWLDTTMVGNDGAHACWLLVQHAGPTMRDRSLPLLRDAVERGAAARRDLAYLQDRVDMHHHRPQTHGTQSLGFGDRPPRLWPVRDPATVNQRRRALGLPDLDDRTLAETWTDDELTEYRGYLPGDD